MGFFHNGASVQPCGLVMFSHHLYLELHDATRTIELIRTRSPTPNFGVLLVGNRGKS